MTLVKICGITNLADALAAVELGADFLGFNFYPGSKRYVDFETCLSILPEIPEAVQKVGVFVNCDPQLIIDIATQLNLDLLQFHGDEKPVYCNQFARPFMKAFRLQNEEELKSIPEYDGDYILIDAYDPKKFGGTGKLSNWELTKRAKYYGKVFLSGGITPENVSQAIDEVQPYAIDVASGVESAPGKKDYDKMEKLIQMVKGI